MLDSVLLAAWMFQRTLFAAAVLPPERFAGLLGDGWKVTGVEMRWIA